MVCICMRNMKYMIDEARIDSLSQWIADAVMALHAKGVPVNAETVSAVVKGVLDETVGALAEASDELSPNANRAAKAKKALSVYAALSGDVSVGDGFVATLGDFMTDALHADAEGSAGGVEPLSLDEFADLSTVSMQNFIVERDNLYESTPHPRVAPTLEQL